MSKSKAGRLAVFISGLVLMLISEASPGCIDSNGVKVEPGQLAAPSFKRGFSIVGWNQGDLATPRAEGVLRSMAAAGANAVSIVPTWYQASGESRAVSPEAPGSGTQLTEVRSLVRIGRELGLHVTLKPHVDARDGVWRGDFLPGGPGGSLADRQG
ncbi:MAG: hypothetical protein AAB289_02295, partial [Chloroflexota bacterium]